MQGQLISGRYRLAEVIGSGGMGRVWRAHDEILNRIVAIKELTAALYVSESDQERLLARTRVEARAAARINHSAVVTVHDVLEHDCRPWIVMELVEGYSLADAINEYGRVAPTEAARIGLWVVSALNAAHSVGVLHRDIKPGNILLGEDGRVLLTDFGIAQIEDDTNTAVTRTGEVVGSVDYLAPERLRGQGPCALSDLWALGATLFTAVEGRPPFRRTSALSTIQAVIQEDAEEPQHAGSLAPVIAALLRKDPAARPTIAEAEQMLTEALENPQRIEPTQHSGNEPEADAAPEQPEASADAPCSPVTEPIDPYASHGSQAVPMSTRAKRRHLRTVALIAAFAAMVGGGTVVLIQKWGPLDRGSAKASGLSPEPLQTGTEFDQEAGVPALWKRVDDPLGFSLHLPEDWRREVVDEDLDGIRHVDYSPDGGRHFIRIDVNTSPKFASAHEHFTQLEQQLKRELAGYRLVEMAENLFRQQEGSLWEYTWDAQARDASFPAPRHTINQAYIDWDGTEYTISMNSPESDWPTSREEFDLVLQSWKTDRS
ncbi:serine/threonine-protein kinase [Streptomyces canus]|uniref:serine/threonine-protein kinase n=1 Tax=Streptomyces canus TaxID=58343 RepID=UPI000362426E|nr:serine/threonine-protein kinase [Streptomyces canus]